MLMDERTELEQELFAYDEIRRVQAKVVVYPNAKQIHVLDLNKDVTVTNGIEVIKKQILEAADLDSSNVNDYEWILYGTDGIVSQHDGVFGPSPIVDTNLAEEMSARYAKGGR